MTKQTFLKGTLILILAGLATRILGFMNRIVLARVMGKEGVGLYMMAVPTLILAITITQLGLPIAISKLVAEANAMNNRAKIKQILVTSLTITGSISMVFTIILLILAPILSEHFFTDSRIFYPLVATLPVIPIIAVSSVIRGYFQGMQNMKPGAYSQLVEQIVRITLVYICTSSLLPYGVEYAAAGAMISSVIGEFASLLYMFILFKYKKTFDIRNQFLGVLKTSKKTMNELLQIALPATGSRLVNATSMFVEPIIVAQSLAIAGVASGIATQQYGELVGYALPLLMLPSFITYALSVTLVPNISEALAEKQFQLIDYRIRQAIRLSLISGGLPAVLLYLYANPIMTLMYGDTTGAAFLTFMSPLFIFYYIQGPLTSILQALNLAKAAMWNSIIGTVVKIIVIFALVTQPSFQIMGAAIAILVGLVIVTLLHYATILKVIPFTIDLKEYLLIAAASFLSGVITIGLTRLLPMPQSLLLNTLTGIIIITISYLFLLVLFGLFKMEDLKLKKN